MKKPPECSLVASSLDKKETLISPWGHTSPSRSAAWMPRHREQVWCGIAHWHHHNTSKRSIPSRMLDADVEVHCSSGTHSLSFKTTFYEDYTTAKPAMSS